MKVYRDYDQAALDAQYNLRARFADHAVHIAKWERDGEAARAQPGWRLDLAYGLTPDETLDLAAPPAAPGRRAPLLVYFHGGYWQALNKKHGAGLAAAYVQAGAAFATVNYTLAPAASLDEIVRQGRAALAWLWRHAPALGCDGGRIAVCGHSAGGHIAAMMAATDWPALGGLPADLVKAVFPISGIYDLEPIRLSYQNAVLKLDAAAVARNSPVRLTPRVRRMALAVGDKEPDEFLRQQEELARAWRRQGVEVEIVPAAGLHHFDILEKLGDPGHPVGAAGLKLMRSL